MYKSRRILTFMTFLIAGLGAVAHATPIDPVFSMGDPGTGTPVGIVFTFGSNANGGGVLPFNNASGIHWNSLDVFVDLPANSSITCLPGPFFNSCQFSQTSLPGGNARFDIGVADLSGEGGIAPGEFFTINLNDLIRGQQNPDPNGPGGWGPDSDFTAVANNSAPEPASWLLFASGLAFIGATRRRGRRTPA